MTPHADRSGGTPSENANRLLHLAAELAGELAGEENRHPAVSLDTHLEHGAGLDSLGRAELFARVEQAFGVSLPPRLLTAARTCADLLPWLDPGAPPGAHPPGCRNDPPAHAVPDDGAPAPRDKSRAGFFATVYAAYAWLAFGLIAWVCWLLVLPPAPLCFRWSVAHHGARALALACGTRIRVRGRPPPAGPCVLVANHASYIDPMVLSAVLPSPVRFVAKAELAEQIITRIPLHRIRAVFVERFNAEQGLADSRRMSAEAAAGPPLLFFPEGTFRPEAGLLPFRMGAFVAAASAGIPVVPVIIGGARHILRADTWFPKKGGLSVTFLAPVPPAAGGWNGAVDLKHRVRRDMLRHLDQPDREDTATVG